MMKKTIAITSIVTLAAVAVLSPTASAAPVGTALTTDGTIKFVDGPVDESGKIVKPNENDINGDKEEIIDLEDKGAFGTGPLRIQFVPNFVFGTKAGFTSDAQEQNAKLIDYKKADGTASGKKIPAFVQVTNNTGDANLTWKLSAKSSKFEQVDASGNKIAGGQVLDGAYISLDGSTLTMTKGTSASAATAASKQATSKIPTDGTSLVVLSSKADTNGKQISNVFHDNYTEAGTYATDDSAGVKFVKPAGQAALKDANYKATITWTLENGY